jgi:hypothetical protein
MKPVKTAYGFHLARMGLSESFEARFAVDRSARVRQSGWRAAPWIGEVTDVTILAT